MKFIVDVRTILPLALSAAANLNSLTPAATGSRYRFAALRKAALSCVVGCRNARGLASRLVDGFEESSIGVGCAEPMESVRDEIDVSGDSVEGAML